MRSVRDSQCYYGVSGEHLEDMSIWSVKCRAWQYIDRRDKQSLARRLVMQVAVVYASLLVHLIPFFPHACACVAIEMSSTITHYLFDYIYREEAVLTRDGVLCLAWA
jgi:hypothetical protein